MISRLLVLVVAAVLLAGCAKLVVVPVSKDMSADGMFYALPKTVVKVGVKVDHTIATPAPFMKFAAIFAPEGQPVCSNLKCEGEGEKENYKLQQGALFTTFGEPDPNHIYVVKFVGGGAIDQSVSLAWNDTGLLSSASASVTNRTTDIAISGLRLVAGLGTKMAYGGKMPIKVEKNKFCPNLSKKNDAWVIPILEAANAALVVNYCDMKVENRNALNKKEDESLLELAAKAYKDVANLLTKRDNLLFGDAQAANPEALLGRVNTIIDQRLAELYLGSKKTETWEGYLEVRDLRVDEVIPVLRIDPKAGICIGRAELAPDAKPYPDHFNILKENACQKALPVSMALSYYPNDDRQLFKKVRDNTVAPSGDRSFRYRIPAQVRAELKDAKKTYGAGVLSVAQLGVVVSLPANRNSKTLSHNLTFMENTGGLKNFKLDTTGGLDSTTVDALSGISGSVLDARNAARKAEQAATDEVAVLTRKSTLLKLKDEICEIQKKYGQTCTMQP